MIRRNLQKYIENLATRCPVVTLTGPRQAGKTTLCQLAFPQKPYASLEDPEVRAFALSDPRGFLAQYPSGAVLDEVQRAPELTSYLQGMVDADPTPGRFVLTGSQHFGLVEGMSQSLAGRTAIAHLLPLSLDELWRFDRAPDSLYEVLVNGAYPAIHDRGLPAREWLAAYTRTYVERDVRQVLNVTDLLAFQTFVELCAGRTGQLLNLSSLAGDAGITHNTARAWLSVLEASFIVHRLRPFRRNLKRRLVKTAKLHFFDTGLACYLLGIHTATDLARHPLRGAIFESWVISEIIKAHLHRGWQPRISFYRDQKKTELDLIVEVGEKLLAVEVKSGQTIAGDFFGTLSKFAALIRDRHMGEVASYLVYGGEQNQRRSDTHVVSWRAIQDFDWGARD